MGTDSGMSRKDLDLRFDQIRQKLDFAGWDYVVMSHDHIRIKDVAGAILYDEFFGLHTTCNFFRKYL